MKVKIKKRGNQGQAFASDSRVAQVQRRIVKAIMALETTPHISEAQANSMVKTDSGTLVIITAGHVETLKIRNAVMGVETRGVTVFFNDYRIATAPKRNEHVAARSIRASRSSTPPPDAA